VKCPGCGGTEFLMGTDGTERYAAVAEVCRTCGRVETFVVDLETEVTEP
jgi:hypothetical protein